VFEARDHILAAGRLPRWMRMCHRRIEARNPPSPAARSNQLGSKREVTHYAGPAAQNLALGRRVNDLSNA
jgi:hypothetical protein